MILPIYDAVEWVHPVDILNVIQRCPADNRVLECAVAAQAHFIITGDRRDLVSLNEFRGIKILQPRVFLDTWSS